MLAEGWLWWVLGVALLIGLPLSILYGIAMFLWSLPRWYRWHFKGEREAHLEEMRAYREQERHRRLERSQRPSPPAPQKAPRQKRSPPVPRFPRNDVPIPMDVQGTAAERYQQRYKLLHRRYGATLPDAKWTALHELFERESKLERDDRL